MFTSVTLPSDPSEPLLSLPADAEPLVRVNAPQTFLWGFGATAREVWEFRELLANLVRKELKVKYKDSTLGFLWSLARPTFLLAVYYMVFGVFLKSGIPDFAFYLFAGLVAWDLFGAVLGGCTGSIVGNAGLIKKVYFPREIMPLASVGAAVVHFLLQLVVLFTAMAIFKPTFFGPNLLLLPIAFLAELLFMTGVGLLLAAANVYLRDVQHLLEVVLLFWFWTTPIVYPINQALNSLGKHHLSQVYLANPMVNVVLGFQRALYHGTFKAGPHGTCPCTPVLYGGDILLRLAAVIVFSLGLLWFSQRVFARAQGNFAQEL